MKGFIKGTDTANIVVFDKVLDEKTNVWFYKLRQNGKEYNLNQIVVTDLENEIPHLIINSKSVPINISHFQGTSRTRYLELMEKITNESILSSFPENLSIVTTYTDESACILYNQLKRNNIDCINGFDTLENSEEVTWNMTDKIKYILTALSKVKTEYVLILDGYDVLINSFDNILKKFKDTKLRMLFNATKNNYPNTHVDKIHDRDWRGDFRYFNAGCAIGYVNDFITFYTDCLQIMEEIANPWGSEQFILRNVFAKYSEFVNTEKAYMDFDWECNIFQTYINTVSVKLQDNIIAIV